MKNNWLAPLKVYTHPRVVTLFFLGFASGLPILLVFSSLSVWLREAGVSRSTIGFFSWVALAYGFKWIWSPLVDKLPLPFLSKFLGRRRAWLALSQVSIIFAIVGMAMIDPVNNLYLMAIFAVLVAFSSATQDIVIDAYRIESAEINLQAAMAASYMAGYRLALIVATTGVLLIAAYFDPSESTYEPLPWKIAYLSMALMMSIGLITTFTIKEPITQSDKDNFEKLEKINNLMKRYTQLPEFIAHFIVWFQGAFISPFADFFMRYRWHALLLLTLIATYRISDIVLGIIANVFYVDMGFTKGEIALISKTYGVIMTLVGALLGGVLATRYGVAKILFLGAFLSSVTNVLFAAMTNIGHNVIALTVVISMDNLSGGIATAAFIAYLSGLTNVSYSATQYALFSSMMLLFPKFIGGFSGIAIDSMGYPAFFIGTAIIGIPVLILIVLATKYMPSNQQSTKIST